MRRMHGVGGMEWVERMGWSDARGFLLTSSSLLNPQALVQLFDSACLLQSESKSLAQNGVVCVFQILWLISATQQHESTGGVSRCSHGRSHGNFRDNSPIFAKQDEQSTEKVIGTTTFQGTPLCLTRWIEYILQVRRAFEN